jgi:trk system potassium uptake protein TrkH
LLGVVTAASLILQAGILQSQMQPILDLINIVLAAGFAAFWITEMAEARAIRDALRRRRIELLLLATFLIFLAAIPFLPAWFHQEFENAIHHHAREMAMVGVRFFLFVCVSLQVLRVAGSALSRGLRPEFLLIGSFVLIICTGGVLLMLPAAKEWDVAPIRSVDAFFTATSAVCVTGLVVRDIGTDFSATGQTIILALIQIGGLGIVTFIALVSSISNKKLPVAQMVAFRRITGAPETDDLRSRIHAIFGLTLIVESLGALCLFFAHNSENSIFDRMGWAIFHSVSAFCNAGFALQPDSLESAIANPSINFTIMALIVLGGLGFVVIPELCATIPQTLRWLHAHLTKRPVPAKRRLSLQSGLALTVTLFLILMGAVIFYFLESGRLLEKLPRPVAMQAALFQSITARTAGFNTLPIGEFQNASLLVTMLLMVVGGSPVSTAGGIKTVTFAVLLLTIKALISGRNRIEVRGRTLPLRIVISAINVFILYMIFVLLGLLGLSITDPTLALRDTLFETVSALSTVGLSTGITSSLSDGGKLILCMLMFVGRVGPIAIVLSVFQNRPPLNYDFPEEDVVVG